MEIKELQQKLNEMETTKMNIEKEREQVHIELKAVQRRLETEKAKTETAQT